MGGRDLIKKYEGLSHGSGVGSALGCAISYQPHFKMCKSKFISSTW